MAIVQSSLAEEVLSRQERAVLRGIYRAVQLAEGLKAIRSIEEIVSGNSEARGPISTTKSAINLNDLKTFLSEACKSALVTTKVPAKPANDKTSSSQKKLE